MAPPGRAAHRVPGTVAVRAGSQARIAASEETAVSTIVKRTTLIVRDLERARRFYCDVLGFSVWYDDEIVLSGVGLAAGNKGDRTHLVIVKADPPVVGMIDLLQ